MVCIPCIVVPVLLWVFHKFIQPWMVKYWNPWGKSIEQQNGTGPPKDLDTSTKEYQFIQEQITANPVIVFSKTTCSYCKMARNVLDEVGVSYAVEELDKREDCQQIQDTFEKMTGVRTVPRVFVGGKCIGGGSEMWTIHNQKKLVPMLKEAGATFKKTD